MLDSVIDLKVAFVEMSVVVLFYRIPVHLQDVEELVYLMSLYHKVGLQSDVSRLAYDAFDERPESESVVRRAIARAGMREHDVYISHLASQFSLQYESLVRPPALPWLDRKILSALVSSVSPLSVYRHGSADAEYALALNLENRIVWNQLYVAEPERIFVEACLCTTTCS